MLLRLLRRQISVYKHFFGAGEVCKTTSPAPEKYFYTYMYLSDTSPAPEKHGNYLYSPFRRRRSVYIHVTYMAPEKVGEAGEVFIYTGGIGYSLAWTWITKLWCYAYGLPLPEVHAFMLQNPRNA